MKSKAPNQPHFGLQYDAAGMILDPHPPLTFDPDAMSSARGTNAIEEAKKLAVALSRVTFASQAEYDDYLKRFRACSESIEGIITDPRNAQTYDWLQDAWRAADRRSGYQFSTDADIEESR